MKRQLRCGAQEGEGTIKRQQNRPAKECLPLCAFVCNTHTHIRTYMYFMYKYIYTHRHAYVHTHTDIYFIYKHEYYLFVHSFLYSAIQTGAKRPRRQNPATWQLLGVCASRNADVILRRKIYITQWAVISVTSPPTPPKLFIEKLTLRAEAYWAQRLCYQGKLCLNQHRHGQRSRDDPSTDQHQGKQELGVKGKWVSVAYPESVERCDEIYSGWCWRLLHFSLKEHSVLLFIIISIIGSCSSTVHSINGDCNNKETQV